MFDHIHIQRQLYADFPDSNPTVQVVMLLTVCLRDAAVGRYSLSLDLDDFPQVEDEMACVVYEDIR